MNGLIEALKTITGRLEQLNIPYMVFGGIANSIYGNPRQTFDVDIKFSVETEDEMDRFLVEVESVAVMLPEDSRQFMEETNVLPVEIGSVRIDLVKADLPFEKEAISRSRIVDFLGARIRVCTAEDLIIQKAVSSREKDWLDIKAVIENQRDKMDWPYILKHCKDLSDLLDKREIYDKIRVWKDEECL